MRAFADLFQAIATLVGSFVVGKWILEKVADLLNKRKAKRTEERIMHEEYGQAARNFYNMHSDTQAESYTRVNVPPNPFANQPVKEVVAKDENGVKTITYIYN